MLVVTLPQDDDDLNWSFQSTVHYRGVYEADWSFVIVESWKLPAILGYL